MLVRPVNRLTLVLLAACGLLGALVAWQRLSPAQIEVPAISAAAPGPEPADPAGTRSERQPIEAFEEIVTRPLFVEDRRASGGAETAPAAGTLAAATSLRLEGVAIAPGKRLAVIRRIDSQTFERLHQGEAIGQWLLESVRPDRVVLRAGTKVQVLALPLEKAQASGPAVRPAETPPASAQAPKRPPVPERGTAQPRPAAADPAGRPVPPSTGGPVVQAAAAPGLFSAAEDPDLEGVPPFDPFGGNRAQDAEAK